jgi:hypothetical protein
MMIIVTVPIGSEGEEGCVGDALVEMGDAFGCGNVD